MKRSCLSRLVTAVCWMLILGTAGVAAAQSHPLVESLVFQRFKDNIETLNGFGNRSYSTASNDLAEDWIEQQLQEMGYDVVRMPFVPFSSGTEYNIWATKVGTLNPDKMYIVSAHLDGVAGGAADDDASGVSLVLEVARALASDEVRPETSVRFAFWNIEEITIVGSRRYVTARAPLQGVEDPPGSGLYPEPTWLGIIQHDMLLYDHGLPPQPDQIPEADLDIEYNSNAGYASEGLELANVVLAANIEYSADYPAEVGDRMALTDSVNFMNHTAAVSIRENQRLSEIELGSNPHWHQSSDVIANYSEADFLLGFNAVQMTLGAVIELAGIEGAASIFDDGFESSGLSAWTSSVP